MIVKRARVASLQFEAVHEEIAPSAFAAFGAAGCTNTAFLNARIKAARGDLFALLPFERLEVRYVPIEHRDDWTKIAKKVREIDSDCLYINTLQLEGVVDWARQIDRPIVGVVHNPRMFHDAPTCVELLRAGRLQPLCLADHVRDALVRLVPEAKDAALTLKPFVWTPDDNDRWTAPEGLIDIVVPGAVNYANRNFEGLLTALRRGGEQRAFTINIAGGGPDRGRLKADVEAAGLAELFSFAPLPERGGAVAHEEYLRRLLACHAVMPLLLPGRSEYLYSKISGGIAGAIGTGRPLIAPTSVAEAYGVRTIAVPEEEPGNIYDADLSDDSLRAAREATLVVRSGARKHNLNTIERVLRTAGL